MAMKPRVKLGRGGPVKKMRGGGMVKKMRGGGMVKKMRGGGMVKKRKKLLSVVVLKFVPGTISRPQSVRLTFCWLSGLTGA